MPELSDPIEMARRVEKMVSKRSERKYYRFRFSKLRGGLATGDVIGTNLNCLWSWAWDISADPAKQGQFYSPEKAVEQLVKIAEKNRVNTLRLTGGEPTLCRKHLLGVLGLVEKTGHEIVIDTNGILLGHDEDYVKDLERYNEFLHVRVSVKAATAEQFSRLCNAPEEFFDLQINALKNLVASDISCHPAIMVSFSSPEDVKKLTERLQAIDQELVSALEIEELVLTKGVEKRLRSAAIEWRTALPSKADF